MGTISSGEEGKGAEILGYGYGYDNVGKKIKILKNGGWEEYQVVGNFIQPLSTVSDIFLATDKIFSF